MFVESTIGNFSNFTLHIFSVIRLNDAWPFDPHSLGLNDYDFSINQINNINDKLIESLNFDEVIYILDAFDPEPSRLNLLNKDGKIIIISSNGDIRFF